MLFFKPTAYLLMCHHFEYFICMFIYVYVYLSVCQTGLSLVSLVVKIIRSFEPDVLIETGLKTRRYFGVYASCLI